MVDMPLRTLFALMASLIISPIWAAGSAKLIQTPWVATHINGERIKGNTPTLTIEPDRAGFRAFGSGGCNRYMGQATLSDNNRLQFGTMASTRMACPDNADQQEAVYLKALQDVAYYHLNQGHLILLDKNFNKLVELKRHADEP